METTCSVRTTPSFSAYGPWLAAVLAALALAGALAAAVVTPDARDLAPRHTTATLRATAI
jgi:hypothetical protein